MNILESNRTEKILNQVNETHNWPIGSTFEQDAEALARLWLILFLAFCVCPFP